MIRVPYMPKRLLKRNLTIVFVCNANITRSPFIAGYVKKLLQERSIAGVSTLEIFSAGIEALEGASANPVIKYIAQLNGFSLFEHRSKRFDKKLAKKANLVLTMETSQKDFILKQYPELRGSVFTITGFGNTGEETSPVDIPDPTGLEVEAFQEFVGVALREAERVLDIIRNQWERGSPGLLW